MAKSNCYYSISVERWDTLDYNYLVNHRLGYLSDDSKEYLFFTEKSKSVFANYLKQPRKKN